MAWKLKARRWKCRLFSGEGLKLVSASLRRCDFAERDAYSLEGMTDSHNSPDENQERGNEDAIEGKRYKRHHSHEQSTKRSS
jgi:hypothetical protein